MGLQEQEKAKNYRCIGLLAHVDAGKTTLSEAVLYTSGTIRKLGRVDNAMPIWILMRWSGSGALPFFPSRRSASLAIRR